MSYLNVLAYLSLPYCAVHVQQGAGIHYVGMSVAENFVITTKTLIIAFSWSHNTDIIKNALLVA